jgi:hypothetical protein
MKRATRPRTFAAGLLVVSLIPVVMGTPKGFADEGMWTFDNPPLHQVKEHYGFALSPEWLDHARLSTVRFNGGTGAFVSSNGLVLTVHHIARGWLEDLSSPQKDYVRDGVYARAQSEELKCPGLEVSVLISMENVTARVDGAVRQGMSSQEAVAAQQSEIAKVEAESSQTVGSSANVVALYHGGEYWLYRYKKYTDVRIVFAPEGQVAFFGGDSDNFVYPRYDLDIALFRVYENGKPAETSHHLTWNTKGAADGELLFTTGHPGKTERSLTLSEIEFQRDYFIPVNLKQNDHRMAALRRYAALGAEQKRQAEEELFGYQTGTKLLKGWWTGLLDKSVMDKKRKEEDEFRGLVASRPEWQQEFAGAWDAIAAAKKRQTEAFTRVEFRQWNVSRLPAVALNIVRYVSEVKKPDRERLNGFHESQLGAAKSRILAPILYPGLQEALLADSLQESFEELGRDDPFVQATLNGGSAAEAAKHLVSNAKLFDQAFRQALIEGGEAAVAKSTDPLIVVARKIDPLIREVRRWTEENVDMPEATNSERLAKARFLVYGKSTYPDATSTLRLSYGTVRTYPLNGTTAPTQTTFYGLYDRAYSFALKPPFDLPARYLATPKNFDLATPLDFISTLDAVGGSSGSPVINRNGELVGVLFDINIEGLAGRYVYNDEASRAVAVHSAAIITALRKIYDLGALADEIERIEH